MEIYNINQKTEYIREIAELTQRQWGNKSYSEEKIREKIEEKCHKIRNNMNKKDYCKLILLDGKNLVGFISIFPKDGDERKELTPWYSTLYVKKEYRGKGYSKILNDAILKEAIKRGYKKIYLKTELTKFYEKYGFEYIETLENGEKLYRKELS